jgi:16S rRNA (guanine(527)-N(7))-methyltransferase RsmG
VDKHHPENNSSCTQLDILAKEYNLTKTQTNMFGQYLQLLVEWNNKFNLTAITDPKAIIQYHFNDSLALSKYIDFTTIQSTADIGTGAGFPGIPLKILYPHLHTTLIEVNNKKRSFLEHIIQEFKLDNVTVYPHDWRTFLRSTQYSIDYFFARASLQPEELVRIFKPTSAYKDAMLVYWASQQWVAEKIEAPFIEKEVSYTIDNKQRKFVCFKQSP